MSISVLKRMFIMLIALTIQAGCKSDLYMGPDILCDTSQSVEGTDGFCAIPGLSIGGALPISSRISMISGTDHHYCTFSSLTATSHESQPDENTHQLQCFVFDPDFSSIEPVLFSDETIVDIESFAGANGVSTCWLTSTGQVACTGSLVNNDTFLFNDVVAIASHETEFCMMFADRVDCYSDDTTSRSVNIPAGSNALSFDVSTTSACSILLGENLSTTLACDNLTIPTIERPIEVMLGDGFACTRNSVSDAECFGELPFDAGSDDSAIYNDLLVSSPSNVEVNRDKVCYFDTSIPLLNCFGRDIGLYPNIVIVN